MNSTQLHYREATRALNDSAHAVGEDLGTPEDLSVMLTAATHALLALTAAVQEMTRQASPDDALAAAVGVLRPAATDNVVHHAFRAFGDPT